MQTHPKFQRKSLNMPKARTHKEDEVTRTVEGITSQVPSLGYLGLAVGSMALSAGLALFVERKEWANFVGLWAPSILIMGVYNKLVKIEEHLSMVEGEI